MTDRINLDLNEKTRAKLEAIKDMTQSSSYVDIIRRALAFYDKALENEQNGGQTILVTKDGKEQAILII